MTELQNLITLFIGFLKDVVDIEVMYLYDIIMVYKKIIIAVIGGICGALFPYFTRKFIDYCYKYKNRKIKGKK